LKTKLRRGFIDSLPRFANAIEETSKILGLKRGFDIEGVAKLDPDQATAKIQEIVTEVRNYSGSPDFLRRGQAAAGRDIGNLNLLFMFFNARLQGAASDLARLAGKTGKKESIDAWKRLSAAVGLPAWTLSLHNRRTDTLTIDGPQGPIQTTNKEDYERIPEWERSNYFLLPRSQYFVSEQGERVRDYWKIPKREIIKLFGNLIDSAVEFAYNREPEAVGKYAVEFLENISPVSIEGRSLPERVESVGSSVNPLIRVPFEYGTGRDLFRHRETVPEYIHGVPSKNISPEQQYTRRTPEIFRKIGQATGTSPLKLEQALHGFTAGGVTQFLPGKGRSKLLASPILGPVGRRFVRSDYTNRSEEIENIQKAITIRDEQRLQLQRQAEDIREAWSGLPPEVQFSNFQALKKSDPGLAKRVHRIFEDEKRGLTFTERLMRYGLGVEDGTRAQFIVSELAKIEDPEEKFQYYQDLKAKDLISERVGRQIRALMLP